MTNDEMKAVWAAKITSLEEFEHARRRTRDYLPSISNVDNFCPQPDYENLNELDIGQGAVWPVRREQYREALGIYPEATTVLKWLRTSVGHAGQFWPHISKDDINMVAFTPDRQSALADRQVRTTMGKLLRKFLVLVTDEEIQRLEATHRSELDDTFQLAETVEAIEEVYVGMRGDTGCMRYSRGHFGLHDFHPSAVYASPGMGVAYITDPDGTVKARSVVWTNPANPADKRYVRVYGDSVLKRKLMRNGYKMAGLVGAKIRALQDSSFGDNPDRYVMPWIDPAGGIHDRTADRTLDAEYVVKFTGEDFLTLIARQQRDAYIRAGATVQTIQSQNGWVIVNETDPTSFEYVCALTGESCNRMETPAGWWMDADGVPKRVKLTALQARREADDNEIVSVAAFRNGANVYVYGLKGVVDVYRLPGHGHLLADEETIKGAALVKLDETLYQGTFYEEADSTVTCHIDGDAVVIRKSDAYIVHEVEGAANYAHESHIRGLRKKGYVPVAVHGGYKRMSHPENPRLVTTVSGRRAINGVHDLARLYDGRWEYTRNADVVRIMGSTFFKSKSEDWTAVRLTRDAIDLAFKDALLYWGQMHTNNAEGNAAILGNVRAKVNIGVGNSHDGSYFMKGGLMARGDYYNKATDIEQQRQAVDFILANEDNAEVMEATFTYSKPKAIVWAHAAKHLIDMTDEFMAQRRRELEASEDELQGALNDVADEADTALEEALAAEATEWVPEPAVAVPGWPV